MEQLYAFVEHYIHLPYLVVFVLLTYALRDLVCALLSGLFRRNVPTKYAVFIFATFVAIPFWFYTDPIRLLVTYAVGTSFYELIIQSLERSIKKKFGKDAKN